jgi:uncharacterized damage-inducible protein DinB
MRHPLVIQLRFARSEFVRCLQDVPPEDALHRFEPMNCLSWIVGHLASQEHFLWVQMAQGQNLAPNLRELVGFDRPPSTPPWDEMWELWHTITRAADRYLNTLTSEDLEDHLHWKGEPIPESTGTTLLRNIYHYWFHTGEAHSIRQVLGHPDLPQFVGNMSQAVYHPEG